MGASQPQELGADRSTVGVRTKLSALWVVTVLLYAYADVLSFFRPGQVADILDGRMGPLDADQGTLLLASVLVVVPILMVFLTLVLPAAICRWTNVVLAVLFALVDVGNQVGETWAYYLLFGALEIVAAGLIVWFAWRWRPPG